MSLPLELDPLLDNKLILQKIENTLSLIKDKDLPTFIIVLENLSSIITLLSDYPYKKILTTDCVPVARSISKLFNLPKPLIPLVSENKYLYEGNNIFHIVVEGNYHEAIVIKRMDGSCIVCSFALNYPLKVFCHRNIDIFDYLLKMNHTANRRMFEQIFKINVTYYNRSPIRFSAAKIVNMPYDKLGSWIERYINYLENNLY